MAVWSQLAPFLSVAEQVAVPHAKEQVAYGGLWAATPDLMP